VDDDAVPGPVGAREDPLADDAVDPLLLGDALLRLLRHQPLGNTETAAPWSSRPVHQCLCASEWSASPPSSSAASVQRRLASSSNGASISAVRANPAAMPTSFASSPSANPVAYAPVSTWSLTTTSVLKLLPVDAFMTSIMVAGSRP